MKVLSGTLISDTAFNAANIATCMLSNVPGPQTPIHIAGVLIENFEFYLFGLIGVYFGIFSYAGKISATVNVDKKTGVDPTKLVDMFVPAFRELYTEICENQAGSESGKI